MATNDVGMIGLGIMGSAMSANLTKAGFKVLGYDVLPKRIAEHRKAGGGAARSCRDVAALLPSASVYSRGIFQAVAQGPDRHRDKHAADPGERGSA
jgi:3-hydroxyisobutyrate dehydrogenase-like beta-hydroxyacid dehydrogenase